jgi:hypothetical protein
VMLSHSDAAPSKNGRKCPTLLVENIPTGTPARLVGPQKLGDVPVSHGIGAGQWDTLCTDEVKARFQTPAWAQQKVAVLCSRASCRGLLVGNSDAPGSVLLAGAPARVRHAVGLEVVNTRASLRILMEHAGRNRECLHQEVAVQYASCIRRVQLRVGHCNGRSRFS